ncbi:MAG: hypothetical protein HY858_04360 [Candidatus Solibacter usitatus]|nr:hypothetical protein [Candidatus Solibacter usitatus]
MRLIAVLVAAAALAGCSRRSEYPVCAVRGVTLMDGTGRPPIAPATVVVREGKVAAMGESPSVTIPPEATVFDGTGKYIFPLDPGVPLRVGGAADLLLLKVNPAVEPGYAKMVAGKMQDGRWIQYPQ